MCEFIDYCFANKIEMTSVFVTLVLFVYAYFSDNPGEGNRNEE